jgi:hypothetical protein
MSRDIEVFYNGVFIGIIRSDDTILDRHYRYAGRIDREGRVWDREGRFVGEDRKKDPEKLLREGWSFR